MYLRKRSANANRYIYYERKEQVRAGRFTAARAPGVYSERIQSGGQGYGTMVQPVS